MSKSLRTGVRLAHHSSTTATLALYSRSRPSLGANNVLAATPIGGGTTVVHGPLLVVEEKNTNPGALHLAMAPRPYRHRSASLTGDGATANPATAR